MTKEDELRAYLDVEAEKEALHQSVEHKNSYNRPKYQETMDKMGLIRDWFKELNHKVIDVCPLSEELTDTLSSLDLACSRAIASLARHEPEPSDHAPNTTSHPLRTGDK